MCHLFELARASPPSSRFLLSSSPHPAPCFPFFCRAKLRQHTPMLAGQKTCKPTTKNNQPNEGKAWRFLPDIRVAPVRFPRLFAPLHALPKHSSGFALSQGGQQPLRGYKTLFATPSKIGALRHKINTGKAEEEKTKHDPPCEKKAKRGMMAPHAS